MQKQTKKIVAPLRDLDPLHNETFIYSQGHILRCLAFTQTDDQAKTGESAPDPPFSLTNCPLLQDNPLPNITLKVITFWVIVYTK